ncbi:MAG TPA: AMIN domain-containing protein, partial [Thermoanaerobaculia bacterium]|nr:AMIN domain-containing protein [Thermoanaerobaculia bacterium]
MRRTLRAAATAIGIAAILAGASGCSAVKKGNGVSAGPAQSSPAAAPSSPAAEPGSSGQITQAAFNEDGDGARVVISADAPLLYTSYEPRPDLLVVDMPGVRTADGFAAPEAAGGLVQAVRVETIEELGKQVTRLSVEHRPGLKYELRSVGRGLAVAFETPREAAADTAATPAAAEPTVVAEPLAPPAPPALVRAEMAHSLEEVTAETAGDGVSVRLLGDGNLQARDFVLANPPRVVIDLPGVRNDVRKRVLPLAGGGPVSRVRISQFQSSPEPVTRIVLDLVRPSAYTVRADGERLSVHVGGNDPAAASAAAPPVVVAEAPPPAPSRDEPTVQPAAEPVAEPARTETQAASRTEIVPPPAPPPAAEPTAPASAPGVEPPTAAPATAAAEPAPRPLE